MADSKEKASVESEDSALEFLQIVEDLKNMVKASEDFDQENLEFIQEMITVIEPLTSDHHYEKYAGWAKQYLTDEIMHTLESQISKSHSEIVKSKSSSEECPEDEAAVNDVPLVQSTGETVSVDDAPLDQSTRETGEDTHFAAGAVLGLLPTSRTELNFVKQVLSLSPPGEQEMVRSQETMQVGPTEGEYGGVPHTEPLSSWGPVDALLSRIHYCLWCCVNFDITGEWPFDDCFRS